MQIIKCEQKTPEWFSLRNQYPLTASEAQAIGNQGKGLETLVWEKMAERYSSQEKERYTNKDLERGVELEPLAREIYELQTENKVDEVGFVINETISKVCGASPDGIIVAKNGLVEIKSFEDKKHFKMIFEIKQTGNFEIESQYVWQMQMQMLICEMEWCDFIAYNPNFKESLLIKRVLPDKEMQEKIIEGLKKGEEIISNINNEYQKI
jgi:exodeoxyribonuclease (lambda-induced)